MIRRPPKSTRTDTLFPYTTLFRSIVLTPGVQTSARRAGCGTPPLASIRDSGLGTRDSEKQERLMFAVALPGPGSRVPWRSEEHTSELQSLMRISYAVFCLKKKK